MDQPQTNARPIHTNRLKPQKNAQWSAAKQKYTNLTVDIAGNKQREHHMMTTKNQKATEEKRNCVRKYRY